MLYEEKCKKGKIYRNVIMTCSEIYEVFKYSFQYFMKNVSLIRLYITKDYFK